MKVAIYSPYLDTAGGGEKYILTIGEILSKQNSVDILVDSHLWGIGVDLIKQKISKLHSIDLSKLNFIKAPIGVSTNMLERVLFLKKYDLLIYLTDGSIFYSSAKKSFIHFQVPFENTNKSSWGNFKLNSWDLALYNSKFTKEIVEKTWKIKGEILYPPVNTELFLPLNKKNQIISVGRFFGFLKDKKHEILINSFKQIEDKLDSWSLHLVGAAGEGDKPYLDELKQKIGDSKIYLYPNLELKELIKLYGESSIYWHAAGFGETDQKKYEHFGITTVEAMAAGCVPIVINLGGQKEIITNNKSGILWDTLTDLKDSTLKVAKDKKLQAVLSKKAIADSKQYSKKAFGERLIKIIENQ